MVTALATSLEVMRYCPICSLTTVRKAIIAGHFPMSAQQPSGDDPTAFRPSATQNDSALQLSPGAILGGDLQRGGIQPDPAGYRGSNEMLIAPSRTAMNAPIAVIDPHLSWYGEFRFYQIRIYAGDYNVSGVSILGVPFPSLRQLRRNRTRRSHDQRRSFVPHHVGL